MFYKLFLRPILFSFSPEKAHHLTFKLLKIVHTLPFAGGVMRSIFFVKNPILKRELFGLTFPNPVGLAAGLDKNALVTDEMGNLGFGFIEIGTVTPLPQSGNEQPRLFRLPKDEALINRMGFNNDGMNVIVERLKNRKRKTIIGGNIGKNKITPNENAVDDYLKNFETLFDAVDYFAVNVSSPNTPGLRALQEKEPLTNLLNTLMKANLLKQNPKPILLKIAPDLNENELNDIVAIVHQTKLAGIIATNTTISRDGLITDKSEVEKMGAGGLSGKPVREKSTAVIKFLRSKTSLPIIASGGIMCTADAVEKLNAGADLIQLYTGFIYEGPALVKEINQAILKK